MSHNPAFAEAAKLLRELDGGRGAEARTLDPPGAGSPAEEPEREPPARCAWAAAGPEADSDSAGGAERDPSRFRTGRAITALWEAMQDDFARADPPDWQRVARWASSVAEASAKLARTVADRSSGG